MMEKEIQVFLPYESTKFELEEKQIRFGIRGMLITRLIGDEFTTFKICLDVILTDVLN